MDCMFPSDSCILKNSFYYNLHILDPFWIINCKSYAFLLPPKVYFVPLFGTLCYSLQQDFYQRVMLCNTTYSCIHPISSKYRVSIAFKS